MGKSGKRWTRMTDPLILIVNPGSATRKYAVFAGDRELARLHFEQRDGTMSCTLFQGDTRRVLPSAATTLEDVTAEVIPILHQQHIIKETDQIHRIGLRIVAPGAYFLTDHIVDSDFITRLEVTKNRAPLHIAATLSELHLLKKQLPGIPIVGVSDSAFHNSKPDYAWNYGISLEAADKLDIKRFGYHGLSVASVLKQETLPQKVIVCHLGSGASVTAVLDGKSFDTTMGYSPLEGLIMGTRSGSIDIAAARVLKDELSLDDQGLEAYLNQQSGLLGLGGASDIRELLKREGEGDARARLALQTFIFSVQKAIGAMAAALGGVDALVFTGAAGENSIPIRQRVAAQLSYLGLLLDEQANSVQDGSNKTFTISRSSGSKPILAIPAQEEREMAIRARTA